MAFLVSQHGQWGAIPLPLFWAFPPWRACEVEVRYPPRKGYLSDTCAIPYENKAKACDTPLCDTISRRSCAIWGGISHWAAKKVTKEKSKSVPKWEGRQESQDSWRPSHSQRSLQGQQKGLWSLKLSGPYRAMRAAMRCERRCVVNTEWSVGCKRGFISRGGKITLFIFKKCRLTFSRCRCSLPHPKWVRWMASIHTMPNHDSNNGRLARLGNVSANRPCERCPQKDWSKMAHAMVHLSVCCLPSLQHPLATNESHNFWLRGTSRSSGLPLMVLM